MQKNKLTSILVLMMSVIILIGAFCLPASAATSISKATVTYTSAQTYTGKAITPAVTVKVGKTTLKKGTHYTVAYKNNKAVGKATITVTGKGSYSGKVTKYFYISPKAVTNLKATPYAKQIKLTWTKATGATAYQIQQKIGGTWTKIATVSGSSTSYTVTGLNGATKYDFRVRGYAKSGSKVLYSAFKSISATTTIGKATGIKASDIADSTATLRWDKVSGANSYRIVLTNVAKNYKKNYTSTTNSLKLTGLTSLTEYKVTITASNTSKNITGAASAAYKFSTAPASVTNLQAIVDEYGAVSLTWNKVAGADGYKVIYNKLDASGNVTATKDSGVITKNSCGIKNLTPLSYYVFKVVSAVKTDSGSYIYSKEVSTAKILIPVTKVSDFTATPNGTEIKLSWSRPSNIDGYKIFKNGTLVADLEPSTTSYTLKGITAGTSCTVAISAYYKNTDGAKNEINVKTSSTTIQSVTFASRPSSLKVGETFQLSVNVSPENAPDKSVTYTSGNTSVATVGSTGLITAKAAGTTIITAASVADPDKKVSFTLTVSAESASTKVESVSLKSEYVIYEGELLSLNPTFTPATATDKSYTVTGADNSDYEFSKYISVTTSGFLNGKKATVDSKGNAFYFTVTVKTNDGGKTATTRVKVLPKMIYVEYNGIDASPWYCGNSAKLSADLNDELVGKYSLSDIRFKSDNESIATVSNDGVVTCKGVGDVVITAYIPGTNYSGDFKLYSRKGLHIEDAFFDSCQAGKTYQISALIKPSAGNDSILYYTGDESIATVSSSGLVTFKKSGTVAITVLNASDPFNPKYVWLTSDKFTAPSSSASQLLTSMKTTANALKSRSNLPSITRFEDATATNFYLSSNKLSAAELQSIFSSVLTPKNNYYAPVVANNTNYTTLKNEFMNNVPVIGQSYVISTALADSDVQSINLTNSEKDYCYEIKLTLKEENMSSLPTSAASTRHGKVFDILTSSYIDTYLNKINSQSSMSVTYGSFSQRYYNSSLTLRINKATGNIERATYDMNLDVNVTNFKMKYSILLTYTTDVSFKVNNTVIIDFADYQ